MFLSLELQKVLNKFSETRPFHLEEVSELMKDPLSVTLAHPFLVDCAVPPAPPSPKRTRNQSHKGITKPKHSCSQEKFSYRNLPRIVEDIFRKNLKKNNLLQNQPILQKECLNLFANSLAQSTWKRYTSAFHLWEKFCQTEKLSPYSFSKDQKLAFLCWCCKQTTLKSATISMYISAITHIFTILGGNEIGLQKILLKGLQNDASKQTQKEKCFVTPMGLQKLRKLLKVLKTARISKITRQSLWAVSLISFWGCFRLREVLCKNNRVFDKFTDLVWNDVVLGTTFVSFRIKSGKTSGSTPIKVRLEKLPDKFFCPRLAMKKLFKLQKKKGIFETDLPVFRKSNGENLRSTELIGFLKRVQNPKENLSGKSFRSGIPSILGGKKGGAFFQSTDLQRFGRWKSAAFKSYVKGNSGNRDLYKQVTDYVLTS